MLDTINGLFELLGGVFIATSCVRLYRDKQVKGISFWHVTFFSSWGYWNLLFYSSVGAWCSFVGGIGMIAMNTVWVAMILYYRGKA